MITRQNVPQVDTLHLRPLRTQMGPAMYEQLRRLAFEQRVSIAELVRRAVRQVYGEPSEDGRHGG